MWRIVAPATFSEAEGGWGADLTAGADIGAAAATATFEVEAEPWSIVSRRSVVVLHRKGRLSSTYGIPGRCVG